MKFRLDLSSLEFYSNFFDFSFMIFTLCFYLLFLFKAKLANNLRFNRYIFSASVVKAFLNLSLFDRLNLYVLILCSFAWFIMFKGTTNLTPLRTMISKFPKSHPHTFSHQS
ncbi:putative integral membrane protein [Theileria parva strain Muguga]|uniref:putative integral membrane protein n=1 Tax=Theileria parva strain Muguga TaxID=333668 RepID=UPI001C624233|nr:putative integral membrane protein [Theileria parva strain Muguga]KAF5153703.1 putative integral membrane protein [Theileria parva strain Muguga]